MVGCKDYHYRFHYPGWLFRGGAGGGGWGRWGGGDTQRVLTCRKPSTVSIILKLCGAAGFSRCDSTNSCALYNPLAFLQEQLSWISKDVCCPPKKLRWIITTMWNSQTNSKPSALIFQLWVSGASWFHPRGFVPHMEAKIRWDLTQTPGLHLILK